MKNDQDDPAVDDTGNAADSKHAILRVQYTIAHLLLVVLGIALLIGASRLYLFTAISPRGMLIAAVMGVVGVTVGRVVGEAGSTGPKVVLFVVCLTFYAGLAGGAIAPGDPFTMWAFLCATAALMIGILLGARDPAGADVE